jgi:PIN domain nuclease of toxin-antitoxin system
MLLDTCALIWLAEGRGKLSRVVLREIQVAPQVCISAVSGFEISLKITSGKLKLPLELAEWFETIVNNHGLTVLSADLPICLKAGQLPAVHFDPCDRLIIATALLNDMPVVTSDSRFAEYGVKTIF